MKIETFSRKLFNYYNDAHIKLAENQESLSELIGLPFSIESIKKQIDLKKDNFTSNSRKLLNTHFKNQYNGIEISSSIETNIELLENENSFTITTGQQLTLFGGPAFFFYKIIHCISITRKLKELYPEYHFIPVFWLASEDHDKEEISETTLFNQSFRWENEYTGPTGDFPIDENFNNIKDSILDFFSNKKDNEVVKHLNKFQGETLSLGFINFLTSIFKDYGLLVLNTNSSFLKKEFTKIIENEINEFSTFKNVSETNALLLNKGIKPQAKIQEVNFFKLAKGQRLKLNYTENKFYISGKEISKEKLLLEIKNKPESFSPNVFLRPLYQEIILPNLAYIGGPSELSYWMQLKSNFDFYKTPFPLLVNRLSLYIIDSSIEKKMKNFSFSVLDFINTSLVEMKKNYLSTTQDFENLNWEETDTKLASVFSNLKDLYQSSTPEINGFLESEWRNIEKSIEKIKIKLEKQIASKHELGVKQIEQIKNKLILKSIPQERIYHFFTFCPDGSINIIHELIKEMDPFSTDILVVSN
jgi:bacillithiol biosynthesis cysteine-adding enzyme BshC